MLIALRAYAVMLTEFSVHAVVSYLDPNIRQSYSPPPVSFPWAAYSRIQDQQPRDDTMHYGSSPIGH